MELWYTDEHTGEVRFSIKATEQLVSKKSAVQHEHAPVGGRVEDVDLLHGALLRGDLLDHLHGEAHIARVFVGIPEFGAHRPSPTQAR